MCSNSKSVSLTWNNILRLGRSIGKWSIKGTFLALNIEPVHSFRTIIPLDIVGIDGSSPSFFYWQPFDVHNSSRCESSSCRCSNYSWDILDDCTNCIGIGVFTPAESPSDLIVSAGSYLNKGSKSGEGEWCISQRAHSHNTIQLCLNWLLGSITRRVWSVDTSGISYDDVVLGYRLGWVSVGHCPRDLHIEATLIVACCRRKHLSRNSCSWDQSFCIRSPPINISSLSSEPIWSARSDTNSHNERGKCRIRGIANKVDKVTICNTSIPLKSIW